MMKRNGVIFVEREPAKRVVLYPTLDQRQAQDKNNHNNNVLSATRAETASHIQNRFPNQAISTPISLTTTNHLKHADFKQNTLSRALSKDDQSLDDTTVPKVYRQQTPFNLGQLNDQTSNISRNNPYYSNPFFRPKVVVEQKGTVPPPSDDSNKDSASSIVSITTTTSEAVPWDQNNAIARVNSRKQNNVYNTDNNANTCNVTVINGQPAFSQRTTPRDESTGSTSTVLDNNMAALDLNRWAELVIPTPRRSLSASLERQRMMAPKSNVSNIDKVISLSNSVFFSLNTRRGPLNKSTTINDFVRHQRREYRNSATTASRSTNSSPSSLSVSHEQQQQTQQQSVAINQSWKTALATKFQQNARLSATKLFTPKINFLNLTKIDTPFKGDRSILFTHNKDDKTKNQPTSLSVDDGVITTLIKPVADSSKTQIKQEVVETIRVQTSTTVPLPISNNSSKELVQENVPTQQTMAENIVKSAGNFDQQRAIITRVMNRRDFVKMNDFKTPQQTINVRSLSLPGKSLNNVIQLTTIMDRNNTSNNNNNDNNRLKITMPSQNSVKTVTTTIDINKLQVQNSTSAIVRSNSVLVNSKCRRNEQVKKRSRSASNTPTDG
ncbi:unnamed protein product [Didymodactylos carnosus]|uniref:Uncharacterized protein n=1 Tax=Didymodactylos carnosus TaxID=1234261 RepID=A0A813X2K4_9BILA|nr:unnamed protein product [Didymodactylos carnosus]CAF1098296.1 unnamed protein product [Didymodactylos carnosus]CAF3646944.1 unnamed protein product [Didymodactylos carnosus]CAF3859714.1 unnamed protein product [Didymodactylos carnosus]